ncbi:MAG: hypothetical protein QOJ71_2033 [Actinomycetota bacterium]|jgi:hypothetical protein|nr:hypothetical protein [Actinomycetota bacterium]
MTMTSGAGTSGTEAGAPTGEVQVLPLSLTMAEVRLATGGAGTSIGKVSARGGRWFWQHRDGEQSSPIATNRTAAANALAEYHRAFKAPPAPAQPVRRLLFG